MKSPNTRSIRKSGSRVSRGFTLVELMIVMFLVSAIVLFGFPALDKLINRSKLQGFANEASNAIRLARYQAIKNSRPTVFSIAAPPGREILAWVDDNDDGLLTPGEEVFMRTTLQAGVYLGAPAGLPPAEAGAILGFLPAPQMVRFNADGSVDEVGAYRLCDHPTSPRNFLEVGVRPRSVARVEIKKWDGAKFWGRDEGPSPWVWY